MISKVRKLSLSLDRWTLPVTLVGLITVTWHSWRRWQQEKTLLTEKAKPISLPSLETWPTLPKVNALVAAWNEAENIEDHIRSFLALRYPNKSLILCAGGDDATYTIASRFGGPQVMVLEQQPGEGKQRALRRCFEFATGEVIYLTDADCLFDDESFEQTIAPIAQGREDVVTGWVKPLSRQLRDPFVAYLWSVEQYWVANFPKYMDGLMGKNAAIKRQVLKEVGGFETDVATGTDYFLSHLLMASGRRIRSIPTSLTSTIYHNSLRAYCKQRSRWTRNNMIYAAKFAAWSKLWQELYGSSVALFVILGPLGLLIVSRFVGSLWTIVIFRLLLLRLQMLFIVIKYEQPQEPELPLRQYAVPMVLYTVTDCIVSVRALVECMVPATRGRW